MAKEKLQDNLKPRMEEALAEGLNKEEIKEVPEAEAKLKIAEEIAQQEVKEENA